MRHILLKISVLFLCAGVKLFAQEPIVELGFWKHQSLNGSFILEGIYRAQETVLISGFTEKPETQKYTGQIKLDSRSYIWHPNFCSLNINVNYNPGIKNEKFLIIPNRSETRTAEQLRLHSVFYKGRPLSLNMFFNINHNFINREYTSSIESMNKDYGGGVSYKNSVLPVSVNFMNSDWEQKELQTGRTFTNNHENLRIDLDKSFSRQDKHRLNYSCDDYKRKYGNSDDINNIVNSLRMQNNIFFRKDRRSFWQSMVFIHRQKGHQEYDRYQINENLTFSLPAGFTFTNTYRYAGYKQPLIKTKQHNFVSKLRHQLFRSLTSRVYYEYIDLNHTVYDEYTNRMGMALRYEKKIPGGNFSIAYEFFRRYDKRNSSPSVLNIFREEIILEDGSIAMLDNININPLSIQVKDENGTLIYQENIDYILIERDGYIEIQRLPGGLINNGQTVYADYIVQKSYSFDYLSNSNSFRAGFSLFNRLIETYFRFHDLNYGSVMKANDKILKTINQKVYGLRMTKNIFTLGAEVDIYESNVVPYQSTRYYFNVNKNFKNRLSILLNANLRKYELSSEREKQQFADIAGRVVYFLGLYSKVSLDGGYRFQEGRGIDLRLSNFRTEFSTRFRAVYLSLGLEMYRRNFAGEKINYNGGYVKIERKF